MKPPSVGSVWRRDGEVRIVTKVSALGTPWVAWVEQKGPLEYTVHLEDWHRWACKARRIDQPKRRRVARKRG